MAPPVRSRARSSSNWPSSTSTTITAAASKYTPTEPSGARKAGGNRPGATVAATLLARAKERWRGTLVMVGQPAEEQGSGARRMLEDGLYKRFPKPDFAVAIHNSATAAAAGALGLTEARLTAAQERHTVLTDALKTQLADIEEVDLAATLTRLQATRTALEARLGRRYGSMSYTGALQWQVSPASAVQVGVYDSVTTFGRQLTGSLSQLPINYIGGEDPFGARYGGCVFGGGVTPEGASNAGGCLTPVFQSVSAATFRARGIDAVYSITRGPTRLGLGAGYASRRYYIPSVPGAVIYRSRDESYYVQGFGQWALDSRSSVSADLYANYFASGIEGGLDAWGGGAQGGYYRSFGRAYGSLTAGVYGYDVERSQSDLIAQALLAVGFRF